MEKIVAKNYFDKYEFYLQVLKLMWKYLFTPLIPFIAYFTQLGVSVKISK